jgi:cytochrome P450
MTTSIEQVPADLVVDFDVNDPALADDVHSRLAKIAADAPVVFTPSYGGFWMVTRYPEIRQVLQDWETFSAESVAVVPNVDSGRAIPSEIDPPDHTAYRGILNKFFSPKRMEALEEVLRAKAASLLDGIAGKGSCEFMSEFAHPLPTSTFLALMGWPDTDAPLFTHWSEDIIVGRPGASPEEDMAARVQASNEVFAYFSKVIAERRAAPVEGEVTSLLLESRFRGERELTDDELLRILWLLMLGGLHTIRGVLGFGMVHLANNPDQRQKLIDDPTRIPSAVEELLRLDAPIITARVVKKECPMGDVVMQPGDRVLVPMSSACRDPQEFSDPHSVDVTRSPNRHLAFGAGPHRCVGSNLGRVELIVAFEEILRRIPDFALVDGDPPVRHASQVRGLYRLPLTFTPSGR